MDKNYGTVGPARPRTCRPESRVISVWTVWVCRAGACALVRSSPSWLVGRARTWSHTRVHSACCQFYRLYDVVEHITVRTICHQPHAPRPADERAGADPRTQPTLGARQVSSGTESSHALQRSSTRAACAIAQARTMHHDTSTEKCVNCPSKPLEGHSAP